MFEFENLTDLLKLFLPQKSIEVAVAEKSLLPSIPITDELQIKLNRGYLDFIVAMYMTSQKNKVELTPEKDRWFIEEITYYLRLCYPNMTFREYEQVLDQLINQYKEKK